MLVEPRTGVIARPALNAFLTVTADHARQAAQASEARLLRGELLGLLDFENAPAALDRLDTCLRVEDLAVDTQAQAVTVELQAIAPCCPCPSCQLPAQRIHSHYRRTVADLPWAELVV